MSVQNNFGVKYLFGCQFFNVILGAKIMCSFYVY